MIKVVLFQKNPVQNGLCIKLRATICNFPWYSSSQIIQQLIAISLLTSDTNEALFLTSSQNHSGKYFHMPFWHISFQSDGSFLKCMGFAIYKRTKNVSEWHTCRVNDGSV